MAAGTNRGEATALRGPEEFQGGARSPEALIGGFYVNTMPLCSCCCCDCATIIVACLVAGGCGGLLSIDWGGGEP